MKKITPFLLIVFYFFQLGLLQAQPSNDDCEGAIELLDVVDWCSAVAEYDNTAATASGYQAPFCFSGSNNDVWFKFTAVATDMTITVIGAASPVLGGSMTQPAIAMYLLDDVCGGQINTVGCASDNVGNNIIQLYEGGMIPGQEYYIRIDAGGNVGSFELCINNYFQPPAPGSDCVVSSVLCDTSPFTVQQVSGAGVNPDEALNSCLGGLGSNSESNSTWYTWTCDQSGTLEFTLTPTNPGDDLDFVVYELPNGVENCNGKEVLRCMASGEFNFPSPCMGPTGLAEGSTDFVEMSGCVGIGDDNFLAPLDMVSGTSYALLINNFTSTGNGFNIDFGGTGTFLGPQPEIDLSITSTSVCYGNPVTFSDNSSFALGSLINWEWTFGVDAVPATASGVGPHEVNWTTPGTKIIVLTVESDLGCIVVATETVVVDPCCETENEISVSELVSSVICPTSEDGFIDLTVTSNAEPHTFLWSNGATTSGINNLAIGDYQVTITNDATCEVIQNYTVGGPDQFDLNPIITMPTCDGGQDGAIELQTFGGTSPYQYSWNNGTFTTDDKIENLPVDVYTVVVQDANGCEANLTIEVNELELELELGGTTAPSCFSLADGAIEIVIENGMSPYQYNFNLGDGFQPSNILDSIPAGTYIIDVLDDNLCEGQFEIIVSEPPPLAVDMEVTNVSCFGEADGSVFANATGGVGNYVYSWSTGSSDDTATPLDVGTYSVTVLDGNDCKVITNASVTQPPELFIEIADIINVICFGDETGTIVVAGAGGNPPYQYSMDGFVFQDENVFENLPAGTHIITIIDQLGCTDEIEGTIVQPEELIVDAGPNQTIDLGFSTNIATTVIPTFTNVDYIWEPTEYLSCTECPQPEASPVNTTTYSVTITDEMGCTAEDEVVIFVNKVRPIFIPNAFSPNGDGFNDFFTAFGGPAARQIKEMRVFNRWGALVYEATEIPLSEPTLGWDGTFKGRELSPDVFAYYMVVEFIDSEEILYEGDVTIVK